MIRSLIVISKVVYTKKQFVESQPTGFWRKADSAQQITSDDKPTIRQGQG